MLRNAKVTRLHVKISWGALGLMVTKPTRFLRTEEVVQDGLHRLADARNCFTWATMGNQSTNVLQEKGLRLLYADNLLNVEKQSATSIGKALLVPRLTKRLTWESSAEDIKSWDSGLGVHLGDIPLEILIIIYEECLVRAMVEVVPIGLTRGRIPLAGKYALGSLRIVESYVETADSGEKIDELVRGLLGHARPKHIPIEFESNKWTPVHPGEIKAYMRVSGIY